MNIKTEQKHQLKFLIPSSAYHLVLQSDLPVFSQISLPADPASTDSWGLGPSCCLGKSKYPGTALITIKILPSIVPVPCDSKNLFLGHQAFLWLIGHFSQMPLLLKCCLSSFRQTVPWAPIPEV